MSLLTKKGYCQPSKKAMLDLLRLNLSGPQIRIMVALAIVSAGHKARYARIKMIEIIRDLGIKKTSGWRAVKGLKEKGLIKRLKVEGKWMYDIKPIADNYLVHPEQITRLYVGGKYLKLVKKVEGETEENKDIYKAVPVTVENRRESNEGIKALGDVLKRMEEGKVDPSHIEGLCMA